MEGHNGTVRQLNRELEAVKSVVKRTRKEVEDAEEEMSVLAERVLEAKRRREERLRAGQTNPVKNRSKMGGSRRRGRKGRKGTRRGRK